MTGNHIRVISCEPAGRALCSLACMARGSAALPLLHRSTRPEVDRQSDEGGRAEEGGRTDCNGQQ